MSETEETEVILVVDDDAGIRLLAEAFLVVLGHSVATASDGLEGLEQLQRRGEAVRLVLLDLEMPNLDGVQMLRQARQRWPGLPVVLMSGHDEEDLLGRCTGCGPVVFLQKPFTRTHLVAALARALPASPVKGSAPP